MLKLGVLASGRGSNFQSIIDSIKSGYLTAKVEILITDNPEAYAVKRAEENGIHAEYIVPPPQRSKVEFYSEITERLKGCGVGLVILAGFMRVVGEPLLGAYEGRIMNIHPSLLPSFKGLHAQHQALEYGVRIAGCSVHFVDNGVDTGPIIIQAAVPVYPDDNEESLSERILSQEHRIYPAAIRLFSEGRLTIHEPIVKISDSPAPNGRIVNPPVD